jgi:hypothetical protein
LLATGNSPQQSANMPSIYAPSDPHNMSAELRLAEIAAILAKGVLRLQRCPTLTGAPGDPKSRAKEKVDSDRMDLELSGETGLSVHTG